MTSLTFSAIFIVSALNAGTCPSKPKPCRPLAKNTVYVNGQIASPGDGTSWDRAFRTIQDAISSVGKSNLSNEFSSHTIVVAQGIYNLPQENPIITKSLIHFELPCDLEILGGFTPGNQCLDDRGPNPDSTVLHGSRDFRKAVIAKFSPENRRHKLTIDGFTITEFGAETSSEGGAVFAAGGNLVMKNINFRENRSQKGGAAYLNNTTALFERCTFLNNRAEINGGAISIFVAEPRSVSGLYLYECTMGGENSVRNLAPKGGFIYARQKYTTLNISFTNPRYNEIPDIDNDIYDKALEEKR